MSTRVVLLPKWRATERLKAAPLSPNVRHPLPQVWSQFIAMNENKADLAHIFNLKWSSRKTKIFQKNRRWWLQVDSRTMRVQTQLGYPKIIWISTEIMKMVTQGWFFMSLKREKLLLTNSCDLQRYWCHAYFFTLHQSQASEVWMMYGNTKKQKFIPIHQLAHKNPKVVTKSILTSILTWS